MMMMIPLYYKGQSFQTECFSIKKTERDFVKNLVTEQLSMQEFLRSDLNTVNGQMIYNLVSRLARANQDELSEPYKVFLTSIGKYTSVAGYLQVLSDEPLQYLSDFCQRNLDLQSTQHTEKLRLVIHDLPLHSTH